MEKRLARSQRETADAAAQADAARGECDDLRSRLTEAETARDRATEVLPLLIPAQKLKIRCEDFVPKSSCKQCSFREQQC